ncbi:MAG: hypothetical protein AB1894_12590 [Chloroflexota bacterium]
MNKIRRALLRCLSVLFISLAACTTALDATAFRFMDIPLENLDGLHSPFVEDQVYLKMRGIFALKRDAVFLFGGLRESRGPMRSLLL